MILVHLLYLSLTKIARQLLSTLREDLYIRLDTETLTQRLKVREGDKLLIWGELKVVSVARMACAVYAVSLLTVFMRLHLNIIGGYMFLQTMVLFPIHAFTNFRPNPRKSSQQACKESFLKNANSSFEMVRRLIAIAHPGLALLVTVVREHVNQLLANVELSKTFSGQSLHGLCREIRSGIEVASLAGYIAPFMPDMITEAHLPDFFSTIQSAPQGVIHDCSGCLTRRSILWRATSSSKLWVRGLG